MPDENNITVTMSMTDFLYYKGMQETATKLTRMLERANLDGAAVLTDELKKEIEQIYL